MAKWSLGEKCFRARKQQSNNPCLSKVIHHVYIDNWVGRDLDCYMIYIADQQPVGTQLQIPLEIPTLHTSVALAHLYHARKPWESHAPSLVKFCPVV